MSDFSPDEIRILKALARGVLGDGATSSTGQASFPKATGGAVATDRMLDGKGGDPPVFNDPKRWNGESHQGRPFSQCPPEYLDVLADALDYKATKQDETQQVDNKGRPRSQWSRRDAALARGWAARIRAGVAPLAEAAAAAQDAQQPSGSSVEPVDDIPF